MKCRWCGDDINCDWFDHDFDWHGDACCTCAEYLLEADIAQMTLDDAVLA